MFLDESIFSFTAFFFDYFDTLSRVESDLIMGFELHWGQTSRLVAWFAIELGTLMNTDAHLMVQILVDSAPDRHIIP